MKRTRRKEYHESDGLRMKAAEGKNYALTALGSFLFAFGVNLFIVPLDLYSGGIIGMAQIFRTFLMNTVGLSLPQGLDIAGILNFLLNIPLFLLAYRSISRSFFCKTLFSVLIQTLFFTILAIPAAPIITDTLASCLVGGIICGVGIGLTLRSGGCGGGIDILGVYFSRKNADFSVGKLGIIINVIVFGLCALLFELPVAIYSVLYAVIMAQVMDKVHYQNINMTVMIFTKHDGIQKAINEKMRRGVTYWKGAGAYTDEETFILVTAISKYEVNTLKKLIHNIDPQAFVIFQEGMSISGNFEKRL